MSNVQSNISINLQGNAQGGVVQLQGSLNSLVNTANRVDSAFGRMAQAAFAFNNITQAVDSFKNSLSTITTPLVDFDRKSREMQAITNATKEETEALNDSAKALASTYGTSASANIEMFKVALSKLTPELGKSNDFMKAFGNTANQLSLTMYGDVDGATRAITNSLNQYGVDLSNPIESTRRMQEMMDMVAKSAQVGAVEVPGIAAALQLTGNMAYNAGTKFEELQALMQVTGKFAEEGRIGYVLRDIFLTMNKGDFIPKEVNERMQAMGINIQALQSPTTSTKDKLLELQKLLKDPSAFNQLFGQYANEAGALVRNIDLYDQYLGSIENAGGALNQMSGTIAESYDVKMKRVSETVNNFKIGLGEMTGMLLPMTEMFLGGFSSVLQFASGLNQARELLNAMGVISKISGWLSAFSAATGIQTLMQWQLNVATYAFPAVWIIAGLVAVVGSVMYAWNKFEGFRKFLYGLWEAVKQVFSNIGDYVGRIFSPIGEILDAFQRGDWGALAAASGKLIVNLSPVGMAIELGKSIMGGDMTKGVSDAFAKGQALGADAKVKAPSAFSKAMNPSNAIGSGGKMENMSGGGSKSAAGRGSSGVNSGGGSGKTVTMTVQKLVENLTIQVTNLTEGKDQIRKIINEVLIGAISDAETAIATN